MPETERQILQLERTSFPISPEVTIGTGLIEEIPNILAKTEIQWRGAPLSFTTARHAVITDSKVLLLYAAELVRQMQRKGLVTELFGFKEGEKNKKLATYDTLTNQIAESTTAFGSNTVIYSVGGGVTGDLAGFVAATFGRGTPLVHIPTTVMAQVDSCIGGKVGVNLRGAKNKLGSFHEPTHIFIDPKVLVTLEDTHFRNGLAEVVKYGMLDDQLMALLEQRADSLVPDDMSLLDIELIQEIIRRSIEVKNSYVERDPNDRGIRKVLNFGHTIGHAIEHASGYRLLHGEAVAIGMVKEGEVAVTEDIWSQRDLDRMVTLLQLIGLPTQIPKGIAVSDILTAARQDKKITDTVELAIPVLGAEIDDSLCSLNVGEDGIRQIVADNTD